MTNEAEPLQAVLDAPDDDAPRLAYAQWCDDQGDEASKARATLIRGQIELDALEPHAEPTAHSLGLRQRVQDVLDRHGATWAGPIAGMVDRVHFVRGFVGWVELSAQAWLDHGAQLRALAPIQHLDLTGIRQVDEALFDSPLLAGIRSLSMADCGLHDIHVQLIAASPHFAELRWLSLAENNLGQPAAEALAASSLLPALSFVELHSNPFNPTEKLGYDGAELVAAWLPDEGKDLEARFGPQAWLYHEHAPGRLDRPGMGATQVSGSDS